MADFVSTTTTPGAVTVSDYTTEEGKQKLLAEIEQIRNTIKAQHEAERRANEKHAIEVEALQVGLKRGKLNLEVEEISRNRNVREEQMILACDWNHQVYNFSEQIDDDTVQQCMTQLNQWVRQHKAAGNDTPLHIEIVFDSPGGGVFAGMHLFDYIRWVRSQGHEITTVALGTAASMAGILLQSGTTREMGAESYLLIHKLSETRFFDNTGTDEMKDRIKRMEKMEKRVVNIFADRAALAKLARGETRTYDELYAETVSFIDREWKKTDFWLDSDEAYGAGFIDAIR